jgi:hypothetical protein
MKRLLFWMSLGAAIAWFADPVSGAAPQGVSDLVNRAGEPFVRAGPSSPSGTGI